MKENEKIENFEIELQEEKNNLKGKLKELMKYVGVYTLIASLGAGISLKIGDTILEKYEDIKDGIEEDYDYLNSATVTVDPGFIYTNNFHGIKLTNFTAIKEIKLENGETLYETVIDLGNDVTVIDVEDLVVGKIYYANGYLFEVGDVQTYEKTDDGLVKITTRALTKI